MPTQPEISAVITALEDPKYTWRTIGGIAAVTELPVRTVRAVLNSDPRVIKFRGAERDDEDLYTTFAHYRRQTPLWRRFLMAVRR